MIDGLHFVGDAAIGGAGGEDLLTECLQDHGHLRPGHRALWHQLSADPRQKHVPHGPLHGLYGVAADTAGIGKGTEITGTVSGAAFLIRVLIQYRDELLPGHGIIRRETPVAGPGHEAACRCPVHGISVPGAFGNIREGTSTGFRFSLHGIEDLDHLCPGDRALRGEPAVSETGHESVVRDIGDRAGIPGVSENVVIGIGEYRQGQCRQQRQNQQ